MEQIEICGIPHKIGANGLVFMLIDDDWVRSTKTAAEVQKLFAENKNLRGVGCRKKRSRVN